MHQRLQPYAPQVCGEDDATAPRPDGTNASLQLSSPVLLLHRRGDFVRSVCVNALNPRQLAVSLGRSVQQVELAAAAQDTLMPGSPGSDKVGARPATQWTTWGDGLRNAAALRNPLLPAAGDAQLSAQLSSGSELTARCLCSHPKLPLYLAGGDGIVQCWQFGHSIQGRGLQDHLRAQYRLPSGRPLRWLSMATRRDDGSGVPIPPHSLPQGPGRALSLQTAVQAAQEPAWAPWQPASAPLRLRTSAPPLLRTLSNCWYGTFRHQARRRAQVQSVRRAVRLHRGGRLALPVALPERHRRPSAIQQAAVPRQAWRRPVLRRHLGRGRDRRPVRRADGSEPVPVGCAAAPVAGANHFVRGAQRGRLLRAALPVGHEPD